ncbi:chromosome partitioning protein ParA [Desulfosporosinus sp. Tol-M]|nr:chromosome partitioning protein ParA [Desulfosporosinus sp. Tol-M]
MLTEISCELFRVNGLARKPIRFDKGLNIILGGKTGVNSIGKSTMLLIIDFAFGGDTYAKSDAVKQLGNHNIHFTFEFDGKPYYFIRHTATPGNIFQVNKNNNIVATIKSDDYTKWLSEHYHMNFAGVQFRNTISRFFRIYGKNNYNELRPLQMRGGTESQELAIHVLIALFNQYESVLAFEEQLKLAEDRIAAFREARKYQFIPSAVDGLKKYEDNISVIASLKQDKAELETSNNQAVNSEEVEKANQANALMIQMQDARRLMNQKENDLHLINLNMSQGIYPTEADLTSLHELFPEANLQKLIDIERFHNKIQTILQDELEAAKSRLKEELIPLKQMVDRLQKQAEEIRPSMAFSQEFLSAYTQLDRRIHKLEDENEAFDTRNTLQNEKKGASDRLKSQMVTVLKIVELVINRHMSEISDFVSQGKDNPPILGIKEYNSYSFETPKDTGTGTNFKGMLIYDLSILNSTALPALAHDSLLFANVSDETIEQILALYAREKQKQIFIAFDREGKYDVETQSIIKENTVLKLDADEQALFGWKWSRKDAEK